MQSYEEKLKQAVQLSQSGNYTKALECFKTIIKDNPNAPDALNGIALVYSMQKNYPKAIEYFNQAIQIAPNYPSFHNNIGNAYKHMGKFSQAMQHYREALRLKHPYPEAYNNLGSLYYLQGDYKSAIDNFTIALQSNPDNISTQYNLGLSLVQENRLIEAATHFEKILTLEPEHPGALQNAGFTLIALKQFAKAKPYLKKALSYEPENPHILFHLGIIETTQGNFEEAKALYHRLLLIAPDHSDAHHNLATLYLNLNDKEKALLHYKQAVHYTPENTTAQHMVDAITGKTPEEGAPAEYIESLFNQYAYNYDSHVKQQLKYQVPTLIRELLSDYASKVSTPWMTLDLGCGTGLCAPAIMDIVGKLHGVDLSTNMIEVAKQLGAYHKLYVDDINHFCENHGNTYDLIISADVWVYLGKLDTIMHNCRHALTSQGLLVFSIEKADPQETENYILRPSGRFAHSLEYIKQLAENSGLVLEKVKETTLRYQESEPVIGYIIILKK